MHRPDGEVCPKQTLLRTLNALNDLRALGDAVGARLIGDEADPCVVVGDIAPADKQWVFHAVERAAVGDDLALRHRHKASLVDLRGLRNDRRNGVVGRRGPLVDRAVERRRDQRLAPVVE